MGGETVNSAGDHLPISALPKTAVQALYHAVTGKTENLRKPYFGNVLVSEEDIDHLLSMIAEQISHYTLLASPTVTVVVKDGAHRSSTYSSWARYKELRVATKEVTSEVLLKIEFVMQLPETLTQQRCVISLTLDSALPVMCNSDFTAQLPAEFARFVMKRGWLALDVSIDFVDFLVAKNFMTHIEEWFEGLSQTAKPKMSAFLIDGQNTIRLTIMQSGRIGLAAFLLSAVYFSRAALNLENVVYILGFGILLSAFVSIIQSKVSNFILGRIISNFIPGVIIISKVDTEKYNELVSKLSSPFASLMGVAATVILSVAVNIGSSYAYTWLTTP